MGSLRSVEAEARAWWRSHLGSPTLGARIDMGEKLIINVKTLLDGHNPPDRVHAAMF